MAGKFVGFCAAAPEAFDCGTSLFIVWLLPTTHKFLHHLFLHHLGAGGNERGISLHHFCQKQDHMQVAMMPERLVPFLELSEDDLHVPYQCCPVPFRCLEDVESVLFQHIHLLDSFAVAVCT